MKCKVHRWFRIGVLLLVLVAATSLDALAQSAQGTVSGTVYGPDGKPLGGTSVWANLVSPAPRPVDRSSNIPALSAVTAADGTFLLSHVPVGDYVLCAKNAGAAALNPCAWGGAPRIQIANGRLNVPGEAIRMATGGTLQVHLEDPGGLLAAYEGKAPGATLIMSLATPHGLFPLPITASGGTSRDYKLLAPLNVTLNLSISTRYFKLTDAAGGSGGDHGANHTG